MNIILTRKLKIDSYEIIMKIGRQTQREDLLSILKLAEHLRRPLKPLDICENFFPEKPESIGEAILVRCKDLDLLDDELQLTDIGREALNASKVFLKEEHCYLLWITRDFLYPEKFLDLKPLNFNAEEMKLNYFLSHRESRENDQIIHTPEDIKNLKGKIYTLPNTKDKIVFYEIDDKLKELELKEDPNLRIFLEIENLLEKSLISVSFSGFLNKKIEKIPEINIDELWLSLLGDLKYDWDSTKNALKVKFTNLSDSEKRTMKKTFKINNPIIPDLGMFDSTEIRDIHIIPKGKDDAQLWAEWLLIDKIVNYISKEQYKEMKNEIENQFEDFEINFPSMSELAKKVLALNENKEIIFPKKYWFLQTSLDLNIEHIK